MEFIVLNGNAILPSEGRDVAYLVEDYWDDWRKYRTMFDLFVFDRNGIRHDAGKVKIGQRGLKPANAGDGEPGVKRTPRLDEQFETLDENYFSLGQNDNYYEVLAQLADGLGTGIFRSLRDCAYDLSIFRKVVNEDVMGESLLRGVSGDSVRNRFNRLAHGDAALTSYHFQYTFANEGSEEPPSEMTFLVEPDSEPPTNVHVLIGRNGVGKTRCLQNLAKAILIEEPDPEKAGSVKALVLDSKKWSFAGLVAVSFSAFDRFRLPAARPGMWRELIGFPVRESHATEGQEPAAEKDLSFTGMFCDSLAKCRSGPRKDRFLGAIKTLENDPLFKDAEVGTLLELPDDEWRPRATNLFEPLSSGHKVILLTVTRLVELVNENTIVLMDEPEGHLHPPLLSAFIRALSDLLIKRNGVAIVSTHSPVVLQEVPSSCVWTLRRVGSKASAVRPAVQSFGENVGTLTREVFGLEVDGTGFHNLLAAAVADPQQNYESISAKFKEQLGAEAKAILRALLASRDDPENRPW